MLGAAPLGQRKSNT